MASASARHACTTPTTPEGTARPTWENAGLFWSKIGVFSGLFAVWDEFIVSTSPFLYVIMVIYTCLRDIKDREWVFELINVAILGVYFYGFFKSSTLFLLDLWTQFRDFFLPKRRKHVHRCFLCLSLRYGVIYRCISKQTREGGEGHERGVQPGTNLFVILKHTNSPSSSLFSVPSSSLPPYCLHQIAS